MAEKEIQEKEKKDMSSELEVTAKKFNERRAFLKQAKKGAMTFAMLALLGANVPKARAEYEPGPCCWWSTCWTCSGCGGSCSSDSCSGGTCQSDGGCSSGCHPEICGGGCENDPSYI